jgi:hypothetical protein
VTRDDAHVGCGRQDVVSNASGICLLTLILSLQAMYKKASRFPRHFDAAVSRSVIFIRRIRYAVFVSLSGYSHGLNAFIRS